MIPLLAALCALLAGCPGRIHDPAAFRAEAADRCPSDFDVERDLFARTCGTLGCHTGGPTIAAAGLDLSTAGIGERIMAHTSTECGDRPLVTPGDMAGSLIMQKVGESPPCGDQMPAGMPPLDATELACLRTYIAALSGEAFPDGGVPPMLDAGAPPGLDAGAPGLDAGAPDPTPMGTTLQAEAMTLSVYQIDPADPTVIRLPDGATNGTATATFDGAAGSYQLRVNAISESDGIPQLTIRVAGAEVATVTYPMAAADNEPFVIGPYSVTLAPGDEIALDGVAESGAWARVDFVQIEVSP
ncbi:MAG: hypothetical protein H6719_32185 [Sandaracinaceae bacterium]|nr:hypothetical protein [Sandaracinaceae bacterium]